MYAKNVKIIIVNGLYDSTMAKNSLNNKLMYRPSYDYFI